MTFLEYLRDFTIAAFLLVGLLWMAGCASIDKSLHIYVYESEHIKIDTKYTTRADLDVKAEDLADITGKLK